MTHFYVKKQLRAGKSVFQLEVEYALMTGTFLGIVGASGSGKTTLLRCLAGLEKPDSGFIHHQDATWFDSGRRVWRGPRHRRVGVVFQDYALFPHWTALGNLLYADNNPTRARELLALVRLSDHAGHYPRELSGGQKQRLALARALMRRPELLLLDEPLSALDPDLRRELALEIQNVQRELGVTTVVVSHHRDEIALLATEVLELQQGALSPERHRF